MHPGTGPLGGHSGSGKPCEVMRFLLATDGSAQSLAAADFLAQLPLGPESLVLVLYVEPGSGDATDDVLGRTTTRLAASRAVVETRSLPGTAAQEILKTAEEERSELLLMGCSGVSAVERFFLGTVTERVMRHAPCPVLVARPCGQPLKEIVVGVDSSSSSQRALDWLVGLPLPSDAEVRLVTAVPNLEEAIRVHMMLPVDLQEGDATLDERLRHKAQELLAGAAQRLAPTGHRVVSEVRSGDAAVALLDVAEAEGAHLTVIGSHGSGAVERFLLGSVSEKVLRHAHCSVLVVR